MSATPTTLLPVALSPCDEACPHCWDDGSLFVPTPSHAVHKQECAYCMRTNEHYEGIYVCLKCFQGFCGEHVNKHLDNTNHALYLLNKSTYAEAPKPLSVETLGVEVPPEVVTTMVCLPCGVTLPEGAGLAEEVVRAVHASIAPQVQDQMSVHDAITIAKDCPHSSLTPSQQVPEASRLWGPGKAPGAKPTCMGENCGQSGNNWMCLTCGYIGCPRSEAGGNQHAMLHALFSGHPLVVKVGTVTAAGADVHCYSCDDEVRPKHLNELLSGLGIDAMKAVKSSKTLSELMIDHTLKHDFSAVTEQGKSLVPAFGGGFTGLKNFGNTCYMAAVIQLLAAQPQFIRRYVTGPLSNHIATCTAANPLECYGCVTEKLFKALASGEFAADRETPRLRERLNGVTPTWFKKFFAAGNADFASFNMQDSGEYLSHLLTQIARREMGLEQSLSKEAAAAAGVNPASGLDFKVVERWQCTVCSACVYSENQQPQLMVKIPVEPYDAPLGPDGKPLNQTDEEKELTRPRCSIDDCLSTFVMPTSYDRECNYCGTKRAEYTVASRIGTFPDLFVVQAVRQIFDRKTGQPRKLDCYVEAPDVLDIGRLRSDGPLPGENVKEHRRLGQFRPAAASEPSKAPAVEVDEIALATLMSMDIPVEGASWALSQTNNDVDRAIDFYFSHPEGPPSATPDAPAAPAPAVEVKLTDGSPKYELVGIVSHIGHSVYTGHWVAHLKKEGKWYIFNDEKVAESEAPPIKFASLYLYRRI